MSATAGPPTVPLATALRDRHRDRILDGLWADAPEYWRCAVRAAWMEGATCALEGDADGERAAVERIERLLKHRDFVLAKRRERGRRAEGAG